MNAAKRAPGGVRTARPSRIPIEAAIDVAEKLATLPRDKRAAFVQSVARARGVCESWVWLCTQPFRRRSRAYAIATIATVCAALIRGERTAFIDDAARAEGVHRSTVYAWLRPFRIQRHGRIVPEAATRVAREARVLA